MKPLRIWLPPFCLLLASLLPLPAFAEYGMLIPSRVTVENHRDAGIFFALRYWRPFENTGKDLEMPNAYQVYHLGKHTDLSITLMERIERGKRPWTGSYSVGEPGSCAFVMEQRPVYDAERDAFVIH